MAYLGYLPAWLSAAEIIKQSTKPLTTANPTGGQGSMVLNINTGELFICTDATTDANVWTLVGGTDNTSRIESVENNVALNFFKDSIDHSRSVLNLSDGFVDQFEDQTGVDDPNSTNETYNTSGDFYGATGGVVPMVVFDGTNDWLTSTDTGLGLSDGKQFIFSCLYSPTGSDIAGSSILNTTNSRFDIDRGLTGQVRVIIRDSNHTNLYIKWHTTTLVLDNQGPYAILLSFDTSTQTIHFYINDVAQAVGPVTLNGIVDITNTTFFIGNQFGNSQKVNGELGSYYLADEYMDFSVESNRRKFFSSSGARVNLGVDGSTPTGNQPLIFLNNPTSTWQNNLGSGGNFSEVGALTSGTDGMEFSEDMTLVSEPVTALAVPTTAQVTLFKEDIDAITLNIDLIAWVSRSNQTFTSTNATNVLNATAHGLSDTDRVVLTSSGIDLPLGLDSSVVYYVVTSTTDTFQVSLTSGGAAVSFTDDGTGTHKVLSLSLVTLVKESTVSPYDIVSGTVDVSSQPSGTDMSLVVQSKNLKDVKIHGQSLQWS